MARSGTQCRSYHRSDKHANFSHSCLGSAGNAWSAMRSARVSPTPQRHEARMSPDAQADGDGSTRDALSRAPASTTQWIFRTRHFA